MLKSNSPINKTSNTSMFQGKPQLKDQLNQNLATLDNIKVREKMRGMQNAQAFGNSTSIAKQAMNLHLSQKPQNKNITPLVRNRTARDYANR